MNPDYKDIGMKIGLEIHQQLNTRAKLFCCCRPQLFKEDPEITFLRRLRPTQSELGQIDPAAYFEFQKGLRIRYEANSFTSCLVEMDEEPPHALNPEAVATALTTIVLMSSEPVDEIHVMRKTVIDGSNTTGFQRTCIIGLNGQIVAGDKTVPIQLVALEEDAARKTSETKDNTIQYRIDRLGIPLIEIATAPVIHSPKEAEEVALAIGKILRATGKAMRGLGSIRQDLNVSLAKGALIEIKGVQELELIPLVIENEAQRQLRLIEISEELRKNNVRAEELKEEFADVSDIFKNTKCKVIRKALDSHQRVMAVKLPFFKGFLKRELLPDFRLGTEMADRARFWGRVGGIFHTDELPGYGITEEEVGALRTSVSAADLDAVVFVSSSEENCKEALKAVVDRACEAIKGVPEETRMATPEGTTRYMRPRPGAARMYPETDIPPLQVTDELIERVRSSLPEMPDKKAKRLVRECKLNEKLAGQVLNSEYSSLFDIIAAENKVSPTTIAVFLTETLKALKRDGVQIDNVSENQIREMFKSLDAGKIQKEALPDILIWISKNNDKGVQEAIDSLGFETLSEDSLNAAVDRVINENAELIEKKGQGSVGPLMGLLMKELRGRVDAAQVNEVLMAKLARKAK